MRRWRRKTPCPGREEWPPSTAEGRCPPTGAKGDVGHLRFPMSPLDTPLTFRWPLSKAFAAKRGRRGLGSVRRFAYGTLLCPEVTLRKPPRITVRGQTVQGGSVPLRKALLPSRACPWSTKRPCGPLAFRRATGGSRVQRRVWGVKRGKGTIGALSPSCLRRESPALPTPCHGEYPRPPKAANVRAHLERKARLRRRTAVSAEITPLLRGKRRVLLYNYS